MTERPDDASFLERQLAALRSEIEALERELEAALKFDEQSLFDEYSRLLSENGRLLRERNLARQERDRLAAEMRKRRPGVGSVFDRGAWDLADSLKEQGGSLAEPCSKTLASSGEWETTMSDEKTTDKERIQQLEAELAALRELDRKRMEHEQHLARVHAVRAYYESRRRRKRGLLSWLS